MPAYTDNLVRHSLVTMQNGPEKSTLVWVPLTLILTLSSVAMVSSAEHISRHATRLNR